MSRALGELTRQFDSWQPYTATWDALAGNGTPPFGLEALAVLVRDSNRGPDVQPGRRWAVPG